MIKNYLKVALRNLFKHKAYSFINILGLAVGIAASVLIALYVFDELSYDRFHVNADRTYRVVADWSNKGDSRIHQLGTPSVLARTIRSLYPQVESLVQITGPLGDIVIQYKEAAFKETDVFAAEPSFFKVFTFPLVKGDPETALQDPNSIVITESLAAKCFGEEDPLEKTVEIQAAGRQSLYRVTGVARDVPRNSHFRFEMLVSLVTLFPKENPNWTSNNFVTYLLLREGATKELMEEKLVEIDKVYFEGGRPHMPWIWTLEPIRDIHLNSDLVTGGQPNGSISYVKLFTIVALLILLIGGINFVNLATARSARRAREVGIRKIVGSLKRQIIVQFLGESILLSLIALLFAIGFIQAALPFYRSITGRALSLPYFGSPIVIPGLLCLAMVVGLLAGLYPAFFLSSFKHTDVLKGSPLAGKGRRSLVLRSGLVVFQFVMSILLIIGSLVIFRQLDYIKNQRLGFDKDHVVVIHNAESLFSQYEACMERLKQHSEITGVSAVGSIPGWGTSNWGIGVQGVADDRPLNMNFLTCDHDFTEVLNIRMAEGRFFSREYPSDINAVVINQKAAEYFGIPEPVGKKLRIWWTHKDLTIIGIMDNIHFESLHRDVRSMGYVLPEAIGSTRRPFLIVKINSPRVYEVLAFVRETWDSFSPGLPLEFSFMDERINGLYQNDNRAGRIVNLFSFLAIFVSCLGLFGLAAFITEQRTKEIGVRKVLGARLSQVVWLLTRQFIKWVVIANLIAWPVGYWVMNRWLQGFAFRTGMPVVIFLVSGLAALAIAVITVSSQVVKAALSNPAQSLKYE
jgi:putative ABC transport system permease protein